MKVTRIYLSGPMAGVPEHNHPAFRAATDQLRGAGFEVFDPSSYGIDHALTWEDCLRRDLSDLLWCDEVALLPGWGLSRGAQLEVHVARTLGMRCRALHDVLAGLDVDALPPQPLTTADVASWTLHNFGDHDAVETVLGLAEEAGELCRATLKRHQGIRGTHAEWGTEIRREVGDVVIKAHDLAGGEGFDLNVAVAERWAEIRQRDWRADPIGHGMPT